MPAIVVIPTILIFPFVIRYNDSLDSCKLKFTEKACEIYRRSDPDCEGLEESLEQDVEWKRYRYAVCKGIEQASTQRLIQSYSEELFPTCLAETTVLQEKIEGFSKQDCRDSDNNPVQEETRVSILGGPATPVFLFFGVVGLFFSLAFIYSQQNEMKK